MCANFCKQTDRHRTILLGMAMLMLMISAFHDDDDDDDYNNLLRHLIIIIIIPDCLPRLIIMMIIQAGARPSVFHGKNGKLGKPKIWLIINTHNHLDRKR